MLMRELSAIETKVDKVLMRLGEGDVRLATFMDRVRRLELLVYGAVGFVLLSVLGAIVAIVIRLD